MLEYMILYIIIIYIIQMRLVTSKLMVYAEVQIGCYQSNGGSKRNGQRSRQMMGWSWVKTGEPVNLI